ncbi:MAG: hypothetical protein M3O30_09245 [Planctomycetota bacterium]|nr:hypothetical protein [Planctomycetota bacterium]
MEQNPHNPPEAVSPQDIARGHEVRDAHPRALLVFAVFFVTCVLIVHWIAWKSLALLQGNLDADNVQHHQPNPISIAMAAPPPDPRLESEPSHPQLPSEDLADVRARELAMLGNQSKGWVDANHKFARITITQAIDLAVTQGLPETLPATQPTTQPVMPPASSMHGPGGAP